MAYRTSFDLNRTVRLLALLTLAILVSLLALAVGLMVVAKSHLEPLQRDAESLSDAQVQLIAFLMKERSRERPRPDGAIPLGADPHDALLQAMESISGQIKRSVDGLESAQAAYLSMTRTAAAGILLLVLLLGSLALMTQRRVLRPIRGLAVLLRRLARQDFSPEPLEGVDAILHPVLDSYNTLVTRLARLEKAHEARHEETDRRVNEAVRMVTAQRAELERVERLAAVGEVAAMLAHEIRNPLAAMRAACRSLLADVQEPDHCERLGLIAEEVDRLIELVREQLSRTRYRPESLELADVGGLIEGLAQLVAYQMPEGIQIAVQVPRPLSFVVAPNGMRRSLLNLIRNAQQALDEGGGRIRITAAIAGSALEVQVEDNGKGFPVEMLRRGLRPFVSSRVDGSGLGLAMVRRFAEEHRGSLEIENPPQGGGRVTLKLPHPEQ
jgi:two-component system, NtrC family, sensor kinase